MTLYKRSNIAKLIGSSSHKRECMWYNVNLAKNPKKKELYVICLSLKQVHLRFTVCCIESIKYCLNHNYRKKNCLLTSLNIINKSIVKSVYTLVLIVIKWGNEGCFKKSRGERERRGGGMFLSCIIIYGHMY